MYNKIIICLFALLTIVACEPVEEEFEQIHVLHAECEANEIPVPEGAVIVSVTQFDGNKRGTTMWREYDGYIELPACQEDVRVTYVK